MILHHSISFPPLIESPPHVGLERRNVIIGFDQVIPEKPFHFDPHFPVLEAFNHRLSICPWDFQSFYYFHHEVFVMFRGSFNVFGDSFLPVAFLLHELLEVVNSSLSFKHLFCDGADCVHFISENFFFHPLPPSSNCVFHI